MRLETPQVSFENPGMDRTGILDAAELVEPVSRLRKPSWLKMRIPGGEAYASVRRRVDEHKLHTVCESAKCPNLGECWARGTSTFMILGDVCTRSCGFCAVKTGRPSELDWNEPARVAEAITPVPGGVGPMTITMLLYNTVQAARQWAQA